MMNKKMIAGIISALAVGAISAAAKSYVDVEKLKTKMDIFVEDVSEIKKDIKWMRNNWHRKE